MRLCPLGPSGRAFAGRSLSQTPATFAAVDEAAPGQVVDDPVNRHAVLQQRQGNGAVADAVGVVVRPVDRIAHPAEMRGHRRRGIGRGQLLAEKLVLREGLRDGVLQVLRDGDVHRRHLGAVVLDLGARPAEFPVHEGRLGHHGHLRHTNALFDFRNTHCAQMNTDERKLPQARILPRKLSAEQQSG